MEAIPLCKALSGIGAIVLGPDEHLRLKVDPSAFAEHTNRLFRAIEQVIRINNSKIPLVDNIIVNDKVEEAHKLFIASFVGQEHVEAIRLAQRRDAATPVRGNRATRMADEKCEMKLAQSVDGDYSRVALFLVLLATEGRSNLGGLSIGREEIVCHVLDKDTLALQKCKYSARCPTRRILQSVLFIFAAAEQSPMHIEKVYE